MLFRSSSDATRFLPDGNDALIPPFVSIPGLGESAAQDLQHCREQQEDFLSVEEIASACPKVSRSHIEALKELGAFGNLPDSAQVSLFDF